MVLTLRRQQGLKDRPFVETEVRFLGKNFPLREDRSETNAKKDFRKPVMTGTISTLIV